MEKDKNHTIVLLYVGYKRESDKCTTARTKTHSETQTTVWWLPEGKGDGRRMKRVKGVKYMVTERK